MNYYIDCNILTIAENKNDPITMDDLDADHPRRTVSLRNGSVIRQYDIATLEKLDRDPFTREPFSRLTKGRIELYAECCRVFPNYSRLELNTEELFRRLCSLSNNTDENERTKTILEARCFLQASDLVKFFDTESKSGSLQNRNNAEAELRNTDKRFIIRKSSVKDTDLDKAYVLSEKFGDTIFHSLIIHRRGEGFYWGVSLDRESSASDDISHSYERAFPVFLDILIFRGYF